MKTTDGLPASAAFIKSVGAAVGMEILALSIGRSALKDENREGRDSLMITSLGPIILYMIKAVNNAVHNAVITIVRNRFMCFWLKDSPAFVLDNSH